MLISISSSTPNSGTVLTCSAMFVWSNGSSTPATQFRWDGPVTGERHGTTTLTLGSRNLSNIGQYFCTANDIITTSVNVTIPSKWLTKAV